jgi:hypothetical protein
MLRLMLVVLTALLPLQSGSPVKVYEAPIDDVYSLRATVAYSPSLLRVLLVDRANANRYWEIASIPDSYDHAYTVEHADRSSVVFTRSDPDYGIHQGSLKLFFDVRSKRLLKQIEFDPTKALQTVGRNEALRIGLDPALFDQIKKVDPHPALDDDARLPQAFKVQPLPRSTYRDFARARPERVKDGYDEAGTIIKETVGVYQAVSDRIWFGKAFYDGEGYTGVGAIGYLDLSRKKYVFLPIPAVVDVSVSAILVEDQVLWAGMERHPEGEDQPLGLLRYDFQNFQSQVFPIEDPISSIHRSGDALVIGTPNGIYVLGKDGHLTRHRVTPTIDGKFVLYTEKIK